MIQEWLERAWSRTRSAVILRGGEGTTPVSVREAMARIEEPEALSRLRRLTTVGAFSGDICRCVGDLTLVLHDADGALVGSGTIHSDRMSWERDRFRNDLIIEDMVALQLFLAALGIAGSSRSLLGEMISVLDLHEGKVQFRPAGDISALQAHRVPPELHESLRYLSGQDAADVDQAAVDRMLAHLGEAERDPTKVIRSLFAWLGTATWPAEAVSGDGLLARRMLSHVDSALVTRVLPDLNEPSEIMGALALAAFADDDLAIIKAIGPAVERLLNQSKRRP